MKAPARSTGCGSLRSARRSLRSLVAVLPSPHRVERAAPFSPALWLVAPSVRAWRFQRSASVHTPPRASAGNGSPPRRRQSKLCRALARFAREDRKGLGVRRGWRSRASWCRNQPADQPLLGRKHVVSALRANPCDLGKGRGTVGLHTQRSGGNGRSGGLDLARTQQAPQAEGRGAQPPARWCERREHSDRSEQVSDSRARRGFLQDSNLWQSIQYSKFIEYINKISQTQLFYSDFPLHSASASVRWTACWPTAAASVSKPWRSTGSDASATSRLTMNSGVERPSVPKRGW